MANAGKKNHDVYIFRCGATCLVRPGHLVVSNGEDEVTFHVIEGPNGGGTGNVVLLFPTLVFGDDEARTRIELGVGKNGPYPVQINNYRGQPSVHPYAVFCKAICDFAVGNSHPVFIVE